MGLLPKPLKILAMFILFGGIIYWVYLVSTFALILYTVGSPDNLPLLVCVIWGLSCFVIPIVAGIFLARRFH